MMITGIPCKVKVADPDGNVTDLETFYFATFRKCKKLPELVKKITKLETKLSKLRRKVEIFQERLSESDLEELDEAANLLEAANDEVMKADNEMFDGIATFIREGIKGAGYPAEEAERLAQWIDLDQFQVLVVKSRIGAGYADFFVDQSQVQAK